MQCHMARQELPSEQALDDMPDPRCKRVFQVARDPTRNALSDDPHRMFHLGVARAHLMPICSIQIWKSPEATWVAAAKRRRQGRPLRRTACQRPSCTWKINTHKGGTRNKLINVKLHPFSADVILSRMRQVNDGRRAPLPCEPFGAFRFTSIEAHEERA